MIDRKKHKQEIEALKADVKQKELDLSTDFVQKFRELISDPLEGEVETLCRNCTEAFRTNLVARFPGISFCDSIEGTDTTWYSLKENFGNEKVRNVATNILLMADALGEYISGAEKMLDSK